MSDAPKNVLILGQTKPVSMPGFAEREELVTQFAGAYEQPGMRSTWILAAVVGLCTDIGGQARATFIGEGCDVVRYGVKVYSWLRERGVPPQEIGQAAAPLINHMTETHFPSQSEVDAVLGNGESAEVPQTH